MRKNNTADHSRAKSRAFACVYDTCRKPEVLRKTAAVQKPRSAILMEHQLVDGLTAPVPQNCTEEIVMADTQAPDLITYVDSSGANWQEFRPGSRRKVLYEDQATGQMTMLVQWDPGYQMAVVEHHQYDEHLYILAGTFVDQHRASGPGTYILNRAGSEHQASTPDGCTFLEVVPGRPQ